MFDQRNQVVLGPQYNGPYVKKSVEWLKTNVHLERTLTWGNYTAVITPITNEGFRSRATFEVKSDAEVILSVSWNSISGAMVMIEAFF